MYSQELDYNVIKTGNTQDKAFIMIHGWQGNKNSFNSIPNLLDIPNCCWFMPEAPYMVNDEPNKKTWAIQKPSGKWEVERPKKMLRSFINDIVLSQFDACDTYVMGFSQGAAVCYELILTFKDAFGGIFPIGGFMREFPGQDDRVEIDFLPKQYDTPILIGHGKDDDIVSVEASKKAYNLLKGKCNNISMYLYNGRHKIGVEYLKKVKEIILNKNSVKEV